MSASEPPPPAPLLTIVNTLAGVGLTVISSSAAEYGDEVSALLTPAAVIKAAPFLSRSVVIRNDTGRYIWSFTIIYSYIDRISPAATEWQRRISPTSHVGDRERMFAPGSLYLVTPISGFAASTDASGHRSLQPYLNEGLDRMVKIFNRQDRDARVRISVDSVIYEDGTIVGPDQAGRLNKINEKIQNEKELLSALEGRRGGELKNQLLFFSSLEVESASRKYQRRQAEYLLRILNEKGESALLSELQFLRREWRFVHPGNPAAVSTDQVRRIEK